MPDKEEAKKKEPMVDIDTSGPEVEVALPEEKKEDSVAEQPAEKEIDKTYENERETKLEDGGSAGDSPEKPVEQPAVQEDNKQEDNSKQIEEYSDCLLYTSPSPRDRQKSRMPSSA